jgi:hypothetical protein
VSTEGEFAALYVTVDGVDVTDLAVRLSRGSTIEGRLRFEGGDPPEDPDVHISPVPVDPDLASLTDNAPARADIHDDGTFEIEGISGPRRLRLTQTPDHWMLKAIELNGIDVTDTVLMFGTAEQSLRGVDVVLTNRVSQLTVIPVREANAKAASDFRVIAFSTDRTRRYLGSRYVAVSPPGRDGTALFQGLPPGEYFVAALDGRVDLSEAERLDLATLLERLAAGAARVTLTEGEKRSVSVRIVER